MKSLRPFELTLTAAIKVFIDLARFFSMSDLPDLRSLSFAQLLDLHLKPELTEALGLIESATDLLRRIDRGEVPSEGLDAVTGPLADALLLLSRYGAWACPGLALPGLSEPTGRGALLSEPPPTAD